MDVKDTWSRPVLTALGAAVDDAANGLPSKQNIDLGSDFYAS